MIVQFINRKALNLLCLEKYCSGSFHRVCRHEHGICWQTGMEHRCRVVEMCWQSYVWGMTTYLLSKVHHQSLLPAECMTSTSGATTAFGLLCMAFISVFVEYSTHSNMFIPGASPVTGCAHSKIACIACVLFVLYVVGTRWLVCRFWP